jgi:hypothetical protein
MNTLLGVPKHRADAIGQALALLLYQEIARHNEEEKITDRAAARLEGELRRRGFRTWLFQEPDKAKWEGLLGADLAVLLVDHRANIMKAALVQAKRVDQLDTTERWCHLVGQCRNLAGELRHASWVWLYDQPPASSRAVPAAEILSIHGHAAIGDPCSSTGHFEQAPWRVLARTHGRSFPSWFSGLLTCYVARRTSANAATFSRWLRTVRIRRLLIVANSGDIGPFLAAASDIFPDQREGQESNSGRG